jgi:putative iron-dependent peroxidase
MRTPQSGIFALGTSSHAYLELDLRPGSDPQNLMRIVADLRGPKTTTGGVNLVAGFAPALWQEVSPEDTPPGIHGFERDLVGVDGYSMPATQHSLFLWAAGHAYDRVFDTAREVIGSLAPVATLADETEGWTYRENRDLTGFIDGTENPTLAEAPEVAVVPHHLPGGGGSVLLVQKWVHLAESWEALPVEQQEKVMGRTKPDSIELDEAVRGPASHVSRNVVKENGEEQHIFRRNTPYGTPMDHGTMFIGFCAEQRILQRMLDRMAGAEDGIRDALTQYTTALSGAYYFVPSVESLRRWASPEEAG